MGVRKNTDPPPVELAKTIIRKPVLISVAVFVVMSVIVISLSFKYYDSAFGQNILVEAHGMLFDILVISILILLLNRLAEKQLTNQRYLDEIDDFRDWQSDEAAHRIAGNIKRLNRNGFKGGIRLSGCFLKSINLNDFNLQEAILQNANLQGTCLWNANLQGANLGEADLRDAYLVGANLQETNLWKADLQRAFLSDASLQDAYLDGVNLQDAGGLTVEQLSNVKTLYRAKLDDELMEQVKEKYPHLLEEPK